MPYHHARSESEVIPVSCKKSVMDSIKKLEMELKELKHELALMKKRRDAMEIDMAGIDTQFHSNQSNLVELEVAQAAQSSGQGSKPANQQPLGYDYDNGIGEKIQGKAPICTADVEVPMTPMVMGVSGGNQQKTNHSVEIVLNKEREKRSVLAAEKERMLATILAIQSGYIKKLTTRGQIIGTEVRKSVRLEVQEKTISILDKAQERLKQKEQGGSMADGNQGGYKELNDK